MTEGAVHRALPTWAIDNLTFGVPSQVSAKTVWNAFVSIAMSAQRRGWSEVEFISEVTRCERRSGVVGGRAFKHHVLWLQHTSFTRSDRHANQSLHRAWLQATDNLNGTELVTPEDLRAAAVEKAFEWHDRLSNRVDHLTDAEFKVMHYVVAETERRQMSRVTCPARAVAGHTGLSRMGALRTLKGLSTRGLLVQHSPGRGGPREATRRAAIYCLPDPETVISAVGQQ
ncbi:hypothetical protein AU195_05690 [Mycobacterium sp. IS-1496]|uniref:hypothetical protein n=1 Tax=Mycobacterium sp. IS-1496 TaxID=1772284 RepID=UPI0007416930|nr:hypothetical protein [Mycobacterium sp. IS-1496]KUI26499.1 hypothetical protein AU195_05690 [Mycobacterium sp. IS-1496]